MTTRAQGAGTDEWFDDADNAMRAVNRLRALRVADVVIRDGRGAILTDQQLAMVVMEERLAASAIKPA